MCPNFTLNELNSQIPTHDIKRNGKQITIRAEWRFHLATEKNKLRFERVHFYYLPNIMSSLTLYRRDAVNGIFWSLDTKILFKKIHSIHTACLSCKEQNYNIMWLVKFDKHWGWHQGGPTSLQLPVMWKYRSHSFLIYKNIPTLHTLLHNPSIFNQKNIKYLWNFNF